VGGGPILNHSGETLGTHSGLENFTIGQRRGLGISSPIPMYVLEKDSSTNTLIVGEQELLGRDTLFAENVNWVSIESPKEALPAKVKIRYKSSEETASVIPVDAETVKVQFDSKINGITPGQAAVFYQDEICLGGGIIYASE
jgi:tRNA-specific 2-thiouridylase